MQHTTQTLTEDQKPIPTRTAIQQAMWDALWTPTQKKFTGINVNTLKGHQILTDCIDGASLR